MENLKTKYYLFLVGAFLVYSATSVFTKLASDSEFLSGQYLLFLGAALAVLVVYAVLWQVLLKIFPLNVAFMFKATTVVFVLLFAHFLFDETITFKNGVGCVFIISGITLFALRR